MKDMKENNYPAISSFDEMMAIIKKDKKGKNLLSSLKRPQETILSSIYLLKRIGKWVTHGQIHQKPIDGTFLKTRTSQYPSITEMMTSMRI